MKIPFPVIVILSAFIFGCAAKKATTQVNESLYKYDFGAASSTDYVKVKSTDIYNDAHGYGFEPGSVVNTVTRGKANNLHDGFVTSNKPFYFSVKVPEGNYNVRVILGDKEGTSDVAIRAECRRMMVNRLTTGNGDIATADFTLHIRDTIIRPGSRKVRIKSREVNYFHWDNKLTLEFNGQQPKVSAIEITPASTDVVNVFLAGNSTVVDQAEEPYAAWGQMIPAFFQPGKVAIANYAESGESLSSFISARRFEKILSLMKAGDYAFVEFGHNDQKQKGEGVGAFTSYKKDLKYFIAEVKKKGGIPVLVTSMQRRSFDEDGKIIETLGDYPEAVRQTAKEENVALIDLNAMSKTVYEAWGPQESIKAFVHFPANTFPGQKTALADNTHFTPFGAYEIAQIILKGIRQSNLGLANFIKPGTPDYDPAKPGNYSSFYWPYSPSVAAAKPDGN